MPSTKRCLCGREYEVKPHKLLEPDPDSYQCECGHELFRWKGLYTYSVELIKDVMVIREPPSRENISESYKDLSKNTRPAVLTPASLPTLLSPQLQEKKLRDKALVPPRRRVKRRNPAG